MSTYRKIIFLILTASILVWISPTGSYGRKIKTRLPVSKIKTTNEKPDASDHPTDIFSDNDTTPGFAEIKKKIHFYGFDKTANSSMESFFIVNGTDSTIRHITIEITYSDMKGRQLHQRVSDFDCEIPAGQTRRKDIKSWDTQKAFYFHQSARPRRQATPFDVSVTLKSVILGPKE